MARLGEKKADDAIRQGDIDVCKTFLQILKEGQGKLPLLSLETKKLFLVGGFNPFEKYQSKWIISPSRGENKKYLKPPPRKKFAREILRSLNLD